MSVDPANVLPKEPAPPAPEVKNALLAKPTDYSDLRVPATDPLADSTKWEKRADGSTKGMGYLGLLKRPNGGVSSEISIGVDMGGQETELPLMVPTLTREEVEHLLKTDPKELLKTLPPSIKAKAIEHARQRIAAGKSPFAQAEDWPK